MKFRNEIENATIIKAADLVMKHCRDVEFLNKIRKIDSFYFSALSGENVAREIVVREVTMTIKSYKTWNPWSKVIGYAKGNTIYCNSRKFDLPLYDRVNNFMHESLHALGFSHNGNSATGRNLDSVPYKVGAIFEQYVREIYE